MYMKEAKGDVPVTPLPIGVSVVLLATMLTTLYLGLAPGNVLNYTQQSANNLILQDAKPGQMQIRVDFNLSEAKPAH